MYERRSRLSKVIAEEIEKASPVSGEIEVDESYFGGVGKGKRGRGAVASGSRAVLCPD